MKTNFEQQLLERVVDVIYNNFAVSISKQEVKYDMNLMDDLGLDSIKILELVVYLEEEFNVEFSDEELVVDNLRTIEVVSNTIKSLLERGDNVSR
ncbi:acyl carrier protein [Paenibacillus woosongensis]|uniref:Acyl carrier protein n=1 Tax=Paenibacillus woosongensis TaxID=307580 RepID=A0A7X2Z0B9_9BACL|nr:phosphopantetheine-binding protein [Paenibacillus woosongensis]MUG45286.1 acyl carrier protein [Paenibacillus woosongensis]